VNDSLDPLLNCRSIAESLGALKNMLRAAGVDDFERDARVLTCAAFNIAQIDLILRPDAAASPEALARLADFARRRLNCEPVTRIVGSRGFWTFEMEVQPDVLDPRPDTEVLVEMCVARLEARRAESLTFLDIGTGSGALLAALLSEFPKASGHAIDVSPHAVAAARQNLSMLGLSERAVVLQQSWADPVPQRFDLVVSNPPYIPSAEILTLGPEVRNFDPVLALDGGADGLDAYRAIAKRWRDWIIPGGLLALEIGATQAADICRLFDSTGARLLEARKDYAGNDRTLLWAE
jgi:release factor glutamine methyltransferase